MKQAGTALPKHQVIGFIPANDKSAISEIQRIVALPVFRGGLR
jgi:hypothetical protein